MSRREPNDPTRQSPPIASMRPALIVIAIVAVIAVGGGLLAVFSSGSAKTDNSSSGNGALPAKLIVDGVHFGPASPFLRKTERSSLIPNDIIAPLYLPIDVHLTKMVNLDNGNGPYDRQINLTSTLSGARLVTAYATLLNQYGWKQSGTVTTSGTSRSEGTELLAQHASRDGYNWEVGITITANFQAAQPSPVSKQQVAPTRIALRLLQVPEGN